MSQDYVRANDADLSDTNPLPLKVISGEAPASVEGGSPNYLRANEENISTDNPLPILVAEGELGASLAWDDVSMVLGNDNGTSRGVNLTFKKDGVAVNENVMAQFAFSSSSDVVDIGASDIADMSRSEPAVGGMVKHGSVHSGMLVSTVAGLCNIVVEVVVEATLYLVLQKPDGTPWVSSAIYLSGGG